MKIDDTLSDVFDIAPMKPISMEIITKDNQVILPKDEKIEYDYDKTRGNLHSLLEQGQEALACALEVAKSSELPRAFEVVGNLMKQLSEVNAQLLELHEKKQKIDGPAKKEEAKTVTNNSIFVGTTSDLNRMIKKLNDD
ncbi:small terminase protein [uncultured Caudovirales phage]|uniref:Small terminase protein n=1 Tax=uncultured Caudovirales phage TaxID=2100421 RepID=A0A6J5L076_9CAUD|nr:small terminase protein [uncultured Caudovirales phage]